MSSDDFVLSRRARMRWNTPLSESHAALLLEKLDLVGCSTILDLGCGWAELLMRAVEHANKKSSLQEISPEPVSGIGVDTDPIALERGRRSARSRGISSQIELVDTQGESWEKAAERVLCVGSSHAFGSTRAALESLADLVHPGGRLLFGDGCWVSTPTDAALNIFGAAIPSLVELVNVSKETGWRVIHLSTADQLEWDEFESSSRAGRQEWLLANDSDERVAEVREWIDTREQQYLNDYRGVLGFAYLVLAR